MKNNPIKTLENTGGLRVNEGQHKYVIGETPLVSYNYSEANTAIAILGADGTGMLSHTRENLNVSLHPQEMYEKMRQGGLTDEEISVIVAGTDAGKVRSLSSLFRKTSYLTTKERVIGQPGEAFDVGLNTIDSLVLIYKHSSQSTERIEF